MNGKVPHGSDSLSQLNSTPTIFHLETLSSTAHNHHYAQPVNLSRTDTPCRALITRASRIFTHVITLIPKIGDELVPSLELEPPPSPLHHVNALDPTSNLPPILNYIAHIAHPPSGTAHLHP